MKKLNGICKEGGRVHIGLCFSSLFIWNSMNPTYNKAEILGCDTALLEYELKPYSN